jgi:hypothetical protein
VKTFSALELEPLNSQRTTGRYCYWLETLRFAAQQVNATPVISGSRAKLFKKMTAAQTSRDTNGKFREVPDRYFETDWLYISS